LLRERIVCVNGPIDDSTSNVIIAQLLYLESQHPEKPVGALQDQGLHFRSPPPVSSRPAAADLHARQAARRAHG
jgi:hypothetical protein